MLAYNNQLMSTLQESPKGEKRINHIAGIRATLKDIPLLKLNSSRLMNTIKTKTSLNTDESQISNESPNSGEQLDKSGYFNFKTYNAFLEKYDFLEKVGEGGNGCVYRCQHKRTKRFYAVKKLKLEEEHISELKRIFISIQKLSHPSICSYKALYFDEGQRFAFLVMEFLPFSNLFGIKLKSQQEIKSIVRQLISGLEYLHKHNICHRDIKPENILYDQQQGKVKIIDFGISKKTFSRGLRRDMLTIIGTNFYFAPEIYIGGGYDEKIDIWALGITIYKLMAGYTPFESQYHSETISNILKGQIFFDQKVWGKYSCFAKDFVRRILKEKTQRMSLSQCLKHLWLQAEETELPMRLKKLSSFSLKLSEQFRLQMKKLQEANSKQEGSTSLDENFSKKIKLLHLNKFNLQDSEDQQLLLQAQKLQLKTRKLTI